MEKRGQIYFLSICYAESFHGGEVRYAQDGTYYLPNYPHHIVQRGHNRQVVFAVPEDYQRYLADLRELTGK